MENIFLVFMENINMENITYGKHISTVKNLGFKSALTSPKNEHLNAFEEDLYHLVHNIEF